MKDEDLPVTFQLPYDPSEIPDLVAAYQRVNGDIEEAILGAGRRILAGDRSRATFVSIYELTPGRSIAWLARNSDVKIARALDLSIQTDDAREAICALTLLVGVGVTVASAILAAIAPGRYVVMDIRTLKSLGIKGRNEVALYIDYLESCIDIANRFCVTFRDVDQATRQWAGNPFNGIYRPPQR